MITKNIIMWSNKLEKVKDCETSASLLYEDTRWTSKTENIQCYPESSFPRTCCLLENKSSRARSLCKIHTIIFDNCKQCNDTLVPKFQFRGKGLITDQFYFFKFLKLSFFKKMFRWPRTSHRPDHWCNVQIVYCILQNFKQNKFLKICLTTCVQWVEVLWCWRSTWFCLTRPDIHASRL